MKPEMINKVLLGPDNTPLEEYPNSPFVNFLRRWLLGTRVVCRDCYNSRIAKKNPSSSFAGNCTNGGSYDK